MSPTVRTSKMQPARIRMDTEATRDGDVDVTSWQPGSLAKVVDTLGLAEKEYAAELGFDSFSLAGSTGSVRSYEGSGAPNVAWCSGLVLDGARASISAFCGPLTDVPHLIASASVSDGGIDLYIDWRPRADAAYDPACPPLSVDQTATVSAGPLLIDIRLPLTDDAAAAASGACAAAVDRWLSWMTGAGEMKRELAAGAKQTSTYA